MKVLKFGAIWCSSCLIMKPRWAELEKEYDWLETEYYDADERQDLIDQYGISNIPCFIFLDKDGQEIKRLSGEISKEELVKTITQLKDK
jgi:thioredoxin 1